MTAVWIVLLDFDGIVEIWAFPTEDLANAALAEQLDLPDGITLDDWYKAKDQAPPPAWFNRHTADSRVEQLAITSSPQPGEKPRKMFCHLRRHWYSAFGNENAITYWDGHYLRSCCPAHKHIVEAEGTLYKPEAAREA